MDWKTRLKEMGILWQYSGKEDEPHALWTSGLHADTFNNGSKLLENPALLQEVITGLIEKLQTNPKYKKPDWVVGPAMGAVVIAYELARKLGVKFAFTEPEQTSEGKMQILKRFEIPSDESVLVVEDAISTGGSIMKTIKTLEKNKIDILPIVASVVNWSGENEVENKYEIISLVSDIPRRWPPESCELCAEGSTALRPKANWDAFTEN